LDNPFPSGGYSNEARKLLETDEEKYYKKVQEYTMTYAKKPININ
jgi:ubiquitin-protein ligase